MTAPSASTIASGPSWGPIPGARFTPAFCSSSGGITLNDDGMSGYSTGSGNCAVDLGPSMDGRGMTSGKWAWEFKLVEDSDGGQCTCFGATTKTNCSDSYDGSSFWMYRSYNGYRYQLGSTINSTTDTKVCKGDTIRFVADFDEGEKGTIRVWIKGVDKGPLFTDIKGKEIWPACNFYSSSRRIELVGVEGPLKPAAATKAAAVTSTSGEPSPITGSTFGVSGRLVVGVDISEAQVTGMRAGAALGKRGDLGTGTGDASSSASGGRKVQVGGKDVNTCLVMHPVKGHAAAGVGPEERTRALAAAETDAATPAPSASANFGAGARFGGGAAGGGVASGDSAADMGDEDEDGDADGSSSGEITPSQRALKARWLRRERELSTTAFPHAASCLYWLGGGYERLTGSVALADSATADVRGGADASPVFFEVYGDGARLLWRSNPFHAAKSPAQAFDVRVMGAQTLRLVVRCVGGNAGAHAVWVDPQLTTATDWAAGGWRNDRHAFVDALTGAPRGGEAPVPLPHQTTPPLVAPGATATPASASAWLSTSHGLAAGLLVYTGLLAQEYTRGMRRPLPTSGDVSSVDVEAPFALEPCPAAVAAMGQLMARLAGGEYAAANGTATTGSPCLDTPALAAACAALVRTAAANLRRVVVAGISPVAVGLATDKAGSSDKKGGDKAGKGITLGAAVTNAVAALARLSLWGGKATGHPVADGAPASTGAGGAGASAPLQPVAASAVVQDAVWDFADLVRGLTAMDDSHAQARTAFLRSLCGGRGGVVEVQTSWPCEEYDGDGALVGVESALLATQLAAQAAGWRVRLMGVWPAKAWLVIDVPGPSTAAAGDDSAAASGGDLADFVEGTLGDVFAQTDLGEWWAAGASDALALKLERSPVWDRRARLAFEPGVGAVRVYPSYVATFDEVVQGIRDFLPPATTATKA